MEHEPDDPTEREYPEEEIAEEDAIPNAFKMVPGELMIYDGDEFFELTDAIALHLTQNEELWFLKRGDPNVWHRFTNSLDEAKRRKDDMKPVK